MRENKFHGGQNSIVRFVEEKPLELTLVRELVHLVKVNVVFINNVHIVRSFHLSSAFFRRNARRKEVNLLLSHRISFQL